MSTKETRFSFIVDTDTYAGNFERELGAAMTGQVGDCGTGAGEADEFEIAHGPDAVTTFGMLVEERMDEDGYDRPYGIAATPGRVNNGRGQHFDIDSPEAISLEGFFLDKHHPSYESVEIYCQADPTEHAEFLKARADEFAKCNGFKITGARVVEVTITTETKETIV